MLKMILPSGRDMVAAVDGRAGRVVYETTEKYLRQEVSFYR
jgi:hypothetical protein